MLKTCWAIGLAFLFSSVPGHAAWHADTQAVMGTRVHVEFFLPDAQAAQRLLEEVMAEMRRIDRTFSPYVENSELSKINRLAAKGWQSVSDEFMSLLVKSAQVSELSQGAFDITYASVGRYYDYRQGKVPDNTTVETAVKAINYRYVELAPERNQVRFAHPLVYIDLGGIAKGHAVDRGVKILQAAGVEQASVAAGGDSRIIGDRGGKPWTVGIQHPRDKDQMSALLPLIDTAVSTSGDYERFFEKDGVRYHHILDPATGRSAQGSWSVTILGPETTLTDALSTSVFVLGPKRGMALINRLPGIDAIIVDPDGQLLFSDDLSELQRP